MTPTRPPTDRQSQKGMPIFVVLARLKGMTSLKSVYDATIESGPRDRDLDNRRAIPMGPPQRLTAQQARRSWRANQARAAGAGRRSDCLIAAVENGADAVYFGLQRHNARIRATISTGRTCPR